MYIVVFIIGLLLGGIASAWILTPTVVGTLLVTQGDGDGPYLSLSLDKSVDYIYGKKRVSMKIRKINTDYYE